jgi:hypothetical protein
MQFETLYQELANGAEIVSKLLAGITQAEACYKSGPEIWSILEVLCHLYDEEREDFRAHLDLILHRPYEPWSSINPPGWITARKYNERNFTEVLNNFLSERNKSLAWLKGLSTPDWEAKYTAPFGEMRAGDMLATWVAHDNLHVRQLTELKHDRILRIADPYDVRYAGDW